MNYYILRTVKELSTGMIGFVVDVTEDNLLVEFPFGVKWLKEYEIIVF
jgi:hypothetical protein